MSEAHERECAETEARLQMEAAAPRMLAALKAVRSDPGFSWLLCDEEVHAAIAEAEGD